MHWTVAATVPRSLRAVVFLNMSAPLSSLPFGVIQASVTPNITFGPLVIGMQFFFAMYAMFFQYKDMFPGAFLLGMYVNSL